MNLQQSNARLCKQNLPRITQRLTTATYNINVLDIGIVHIGAVIPHALKESQVFTYSLLDIYGTLIKYNNNILDHLEDTHS